MTEDKYKLNNTQNKSASKPASPSPASASPKSPINSPKPGTLGGTKKPVNVSPTVAKPQEAPKQTSPKPVGDKPPLKNTKPSVIKPGVQTSGAKLGDRPNIKAVDATNIDVKQDNTENKKKRKKWLLLLLLLLLIGAVAGVSIYFMTRIPKTDIHFSIEINTYFNNTEQGDSMGEGAGKEKTYWPGDPLDAALTIKIKNDKGVILDSEKVFLRFKIEVLVDDNYVAGLFDPEFERASDWAYSDSDNYFYYNYFCYGNETIKPFSLLEFVAERNNNILNGKCAKIVYTVEILEGHYSAIGSEWNTAPNTWRPIKRPGTK